MDSMPTDFTSAAIACDGGDVFLSFHFSTDDFEAARKKAEQLEEWFRGFVQKQGISIDKVETDVYHG